MIEKFILFCLFFYSVFITEDLIQTGFSGQAFFGDCQSSLKPVREEDGRERKTARSLASFASFKRKDNLQSSSSGASYFSPPHVFFALHQLSSFLFENLVFQRDRTVERNLLVTRAPNFLQLFFVRLVVLLFFHQAFGELSDERFCLLFRAFKTAHLLENFL